MSDAGVILIAEKSNDARIRLVPAYVVPRTPTPSTAVGSGSVSAAMAIARGQTFSGGV